MCKFLNKSSVCAKTVNFGLFAITCFPKILRFSKSTGFEQITQNEMAQKLETLDPLNLENQDQAKNMSVGLLSSPIIGLD